MYWDRRKIKCFLSLERLFFFFLLDIFHSNWKSHARCIHLQQKFLLFHIQVSFSFSWVLPHDLIKMTSDDEYKIQFCSEFWNWEIKPADNLLIFFFFPTRLENIYFSTMKSWVQWGEDIKIKSLRFGSGFDTFNCLFHVCSPKSVFTILCYHFCFVFISSWSHFWVAFFINLA